MRQFFSKLFSKRSLLGTVLLILLIGEPTVGASSGLFTPGGIIVFFFLYLSLFHLFEAFIIRFQLVTYQVVLLTFVVYSFLVTGLLNKELTEYVLKPNPFITLIRIQASFFVAFAFYLLNQYLPGELQKVMSIKQSILFFLFFVLIISFTGVWGFPMIIYTLKIVPGIFMGFLAFCLVALYLTFRTHPNPTVFKSQKFTYFAFFCVLLGAIPSIQTFIALLFLMTAGGFFLLLNKDARNSSL